MAQHGRVRVREKKNPIQEFQAKRIGNGIRKAEGAEPGATVGLGFTATHCNEIPGWGGAIPTVT